MIDYEAHLSGAARRYQESAIRRIGALSASIPDLVSFAAGSPAVETFPWEALQEIVAGLLARRDGAALQYGATRGYRPLIEDVVHLLARRGVDAAPDQIVITTGSQQGLDFVGRIFIDPGAPALVELPTYSGAIAAFRNLEADLVGVRQDDEGLSIEGLTEAAQALARAGRPARFVYVTPNFQNPAGLLMSRARRRELLEAARRLDLLIVEDDPYGSLYFEDAAVEADTRPLKADDADGRVVYLGSMSKTLVPGFRVAWLVAPAPVAARVELAKQAADLCSGVFDQRVVHAALASGLVDRMAPGLRAHYQAKRTVMERALGETLAGQLSWRSPRGGFFLWVRLPEGVRDTDLLDRALAAKVSFVPGSAFFVDGGGHDRARLSFSNPTPERIVEGARRLAIALAGADVRQAPKAQSREPRA
ncbi:MAG: PLP-dependent aminotransferase family protein [Acidobacteriota bacterium]